ncbi:hypothetical protein [Neobacillus drentensis]|uniref:hypothetical protein n=1 Tax=Neobacillus drentensis TaxID=220684 RepID=UPI002FFD76B6
MVGLNSPSNRVSLFFENLGAEIMFDTYMVYKYFKGAFIGKTYHQGATKKFLVNFMAKGYRDGELRLGKIVHFDEARVFKIIDGKEEFVKKVTKFKSLPMA